MICSQQRLLATRSQPPFLCPKAPKFHKLVSTQHIVKHQPCPQLVFMPRRRRSNPEATSPDNVVPWAELPPMLKLHVASWRVTMMLRPLWFLCFIGACWSVVGPHKGALLDLMPPAVLNKVASTTTQLIPILKVMPQTRTSAWQLGHLAGQAHVLQSSPGAAEQLEALRVKAAQALGMPTDQMTLELLHQLGDLIQDHEKPNGVLARVKGMFKFANMLWLVGILGVTVSIGPALAVILGPLIQLAFYLASTVFQVLMALTRPFHYAAALYGCAALVAVAQVHPVPVVGSRLALAGVVLACGLFIYGCSPYAGALGHRGFTLSVNLFAVATLMPLAVAHQSPLLGFFCVAALFGALGFGIVPTGMGWLVGFFGDSTMLACSLTSALLLTIITALRMTGQASTLVAPFQLGVSVFGTNALLLAGLIQSSSMYLTHNASARLADVPLWAQIAGWNAAYAVLLFGIAFAGAWTGQDSMFAVSATYFALWISEKSVEVAVKARMFWVAVLLCSLFLCVGGHFIQTRPDWIAKVLS